MGAAVHPACSSPITHTATATDNPAALEHRVITPVANGRGHGSICATLPRVRRTLQSPWITALAGLTLACGSDADSASSAGTDASDPAIPRSAAYQSPADPGLSEARPTPFQVELRQRNGQQSMLLRVTDTALRYTVGRDPHTVTVLHPIDASTLDTLYAALREHAFHAIDTEADREATVDGTSVRVLAGRRRMSASRLGQFVPKPEFAADYDASVEAIRAVIPNTESDVAGQAQLAIAFDPSMAERKASVELDLHGDLAGLSSEPTLTVYATKPRSVLVQLRYGPPATTLEHEVDLAQTQGIVIAVDPELGTPTITSRPRGEAVTP